MNISEKARLGRSLPLNLFFIETDTCSSGCHHLHYGSRQVHITLDKDFDGRVFSPQAAGQLLAKLQIACELRWAAEAAAVEAEAPAAAPEGR